MAIRKTRNVYIRRNKVSLLEIYFSISGALRITYVNETKVPGVEVASAPEVGWIAVLPVVPVIWKVGWFSSESAAVVLQFQMHDLEITSTTRCNGGVLTVPFPSQDI